jgi:hypothetical protein
MQNSARATPRTIQFQDNVQIREIPRNDEEPQRQASWDPNLRNVKCFFSLHKLSHSIFLSMMYSTINQKENYEN